MAAVPAARLCDAGRDAGRLFRRRGDSRARRADRARLCRALRRDAAARLRPPDRNSDRRRRRRARRDVGADLLRVPLRGDRRLAGGDRRRRAAGAAAPGRHDRPRLRGLPHDGRLRRLQCGARQAGRVAGRRTLSRHPRRHPLHPRPRPGHAGRRHLDHLDDPQLRPGAGRPAILARLQHSGVQLSRPQGIRATAGLGDRRGGRAGAAAVRDTAGRRCALSRRFSGFESGRLYGPDRALHRRAWAAPALVHGAFRCLRPGGDPSGGRHLRQRRRDDARLRCLQALRGSDGERSGDEAVCPDRAGDDLPGGAADGDLRARRRGRARHAGAGLRPAALAGAGRGLLDSLDHPPGRHARPDRRPDRRGADRAGRRCDPALRRRRAALGTLAVDDSFSRLGTVLQPRRLRPGIARDLPRRRPPAPLGLSPLPPAAGRADAAQGGDASGGLGADPGLAVLRPRAGGDHRQ